ncbi:MAG TPA: glycosyl hydrolase family 28-related protein [Candidatus Binataceae bacterium]|nr:glycosyl hydrolase family 28-related protein [Candidatus Binataceae bacterium]
MVAGAIGLAIGLTRPAHAFINVSDFGANGDGADSTAAIQAAINSAGSTGDTIYLPAGTYTVSAPIQISHMIGIRIVGDGIKATVIQPTAALAGQPVIQFVDTKHSSVENLSVMGLPANPPSAGIESDSVPGGESTHLTLKDISIGSDAAGSLVDGVKFAAQTGADYNNDEGFFENVAITNFTHAGYSILHSNSLIHTIIGGVISNGPIGVYTQGGSIKAVGTHFANLSQVAFDFENPVSPAIYEHPQVISGISTDAAAGLLRTGTASILVTITGIDGKFAQQSDPVIDFESKGGMLFLSNSFLNYSGGISEVDFVGGGVVNLTNNTMGPAKLVLNGRMMSQANCWTSRPRLSLSPNSVMIENGELCGSLGRRRRKS